MYRFSFFFFFLEGNIAKQFWVYNVCSSPRKCWNFFRGRFYFILFYFIFLGGGGEGDYNDSGINITQPLPPLTSLLLLSMNPGRFEAKENSV